jgi:hypothetical protein
MPQKAKWTPVEDDYMPASADAEADSAEAAHGLATVGKKRTRKWRAEGEKRAHDQQLNGSCGQDGLIMGCKELGVPITKKDVYDRTLPAKGDTKVGVIVKYADEIGVEMLDTHVPSTLGCSIRTSPPPSDAPFSIRRVVPSMPCSRSRKVCFGSSSAFHRQARRTTITS